VRDARCSVIDNRRAGATRTRSVLGGAAKFADHRPPGRAALIISVGKNRPSPAADSSPDRATPSATALLTPDRPPPSGRSVSAAGWDGFFGTVLDERCAAASATCCCSCRGCLEVVVHSTIAAPTTAAMNVCSSPTPASRSMPSTQGVHDLLDEMSGGHLVVAAVSSSAELTSLLAQSL